jgi:hypothetical protein
MPDRLAAHWPPTTRNLPARTRRRTLGVAILTPLLILAGLGSIPAHASQDSGLAGCAYPLSTQDVPPADYPKIRAQFAGSRWPDLRIAGTAYVDLAMQLPTARYTDGYQTVWYLSAAVRRLRKAPAVNGTPGGPDPRPPKILAIHTVSPRRTPRLPADLVI